MAILQGDIKLVESAVMADVPEGGGPATGRVIPDCVSNNLFPDISEVDRAGGRVNLRKVHLHVQTADTDDFLGANFIVAEPPNDPNVSITLFDTGDAFDRNTDAKKYLESYLVKGPTFDGWLYGNHVKGMSVITIFQNTSAEPPPIGKTLCLVFDEGKPSQLEQYVRVIDVDTTEREFVDGMVGNIEMKFIRNIVTLTLSGRLAHNFPGAELPNRTNFYSYASATRLRDTAIADAVRLYGCHPLTEDVAIGDFGAKAKSLYAQAIPAAQAEIPIVNAILAPELTPMVAAAPSPLSMSLSGAAFGPGLRFVAPTGILPGSLSVTVGGLTVTDDGAGAAIMGGQKVGSVVYDTGEVLFGAGMSSASGTASLSYMPAAACPQQAHTLALGVTVENRRTTWIETMRPIPAPGTLSLAFMVQGRWYSLKDDGTGTLSGADSSMGAGTISFVTGSMLVSLGALPDAGSQILLTWASPVHYQARTNLPAVPQLFVRMDRAIFPGNFTLEWLSGGVTKTATAGAEGSITGDASGFLDYTTGQLSLWGYPPLDTGTTFKASGSAVSGGNSKQTKTGLAEAGGLVSFSIGEAIKPGSVSCEWSCDSTVKSDSETVAINISCSLLGCPEG